jgi:fluoroacetyl-CoA thioesterase
MKVHHKTIESIFSSSAHDGIDKISEGTHERSIFDAAKFNARVTCKRK